MVSLGYHSRVGKALAALVVAACAGHASASVIIFSDNFNSPNGNIDSATDPAQYGGLLGSSVVVRAQTIESVISGNQLNLLSSNPGSNTGAIRFVSATSTSSRWDFASGAAGAQILADQGMTIDFDWTPPDTLDRWVSVSVGTPGVDGTFQVASSATDSGVLLRDNGGVAIYQNSASGTGSTPGFATASTHHVTLGYSFTSFADGSPVTLNGYVDGTLAVTQTFAWNSNSGKQFIDFAANSGSGTLIDNFTISSIPEPGTLGVLALGCASILTRRRRAV
jgi:hypothetical protein